MRYDTAGLAGATLALAILGYLATCSAHAAEQPVRVRNTDPARPIVAARLCDATRCEPGITVVIMPGEIGAVRFPTAPPGRTVYVQVRAADGSDWSPASNTIDAAACLLDDACSMDRDRDGAITPADFAAFLAVLGRDRE